MKNFSSLEIREMFLKYFQEQGHQIEPSAGLVPHNDDTLLWINSGVAALKRYFDGSVKAPNPRIVNIQKSIRTNDIDNVGKTARHHTFFEMMGNFSIGDYFKKEAIGFAYEFLFSPDWIGFDLDKAYVSVHPEDQEAYDIWTKDYHFPAERILKTADNFWQIGDGPCGPNSEIFIDRGPKYDPEGLGEKLFFEDLENDRYVEVWNIVFSQFDGKEGQPIESFKELPQKNIDTGMGFERLVSLVQNAETNFDTDLFLPIIEATEKVATVSYQENPMAYRVIADHVRTVTFALADGANFANEGRGYVLRRLLRRAIRFAKQIGIKDLFLYELVDVVVAMMHSVYPNLSERQAMIKKLVKNEEERFERTLHEGEHLLEQALYDSNDKILDGQTSFKLYDTYGFPFELTEEIAAEKGFMVDRVGFDVEMEKQKERARMAREDKGSMKSQNQALLAFKTASYFDYDQLELEAKVIAILIDGEMVESAEGKAQIIFDKTPFYAESGGQAADHGEIVEKGTINHVYKAPHGQHIHEVDLTGRILLNEEVKLRVDKKRRMLSMRNHSSIHLLNALLREHLGTHVEQAGSYLDDRYFRFDFSHFEAVDQETLATIEAEMNEMIVQSIPVTTHITDMDTARDMGALAFFEDKYGDQVRVVKMGDVSVELCGGTHVHNTSEIGMVKLLSEESVGSGVRRITGTSSLGVQAYYQGFENEVNDLRDVLKIPVQKTLTQSVLEMKTTLSEIENELSTLRQAMIAYESKAYLDDVKINSEDLKTLWLVVDDFDKQGFKALSESLGESVDVLFAINKLEDNAMLIAIASERAIQKGYKAGDFVKELSQIMGGRGGGRPNFAQGGGKDLSQVEAAKNKFTEKLF